MFDYIIIAVLKEQIAKEIESYLMVEVGIEQRKILYQVPLEGMDIMQSIV